MERAKRRALGQTDERAGAQQEAGGRVEQLLASLIQSSGKDARAEFAEMRSRVFGPDTFWVTEQRPSTNFLGAVLFRGCLRADLGQAAELVARQLEEAYRGRYVARIVPDVEAMLDEVFKGRPPEDGAAPDDDRDSLRVAFEIVPAPFASPRPTTSRQRAVAAGLAVLTAGSALVYGAGSALGVTSQARLRREGEGGPCLSYVTVILVDWVFVAEIRLVSRVLPVSSRKRTLSPNRLPQDALSATGGRLAGAAADGSLLKAAIAVGALTLLPQVFEGDGLTVLDER